MGEFFESVVDHDVQGSQLRLTPTLYTWSEAVTLFGALDAIANNAYLPMEAFLSGDSSIPKVGDNHPKYANAVCQNVSIEPRTQDSTTHLMAVSQYAQPGPMCSVQYGVYQQSEIRNFTEDPEDAAKAGLGGSEKTNLATVTYSPANFAAGLQIGPTEVGAPVGPTINLNVPFVASLSVPSVVRSVRVTQYEILEDAEAVPRVISDAPRPMWNTDEVWGYDKGELLYIGVESITEGTKLYRRVYTFLINPYKWHHFYAVWVDARGLKPRDIVPINPNDTDPETGTVRSNGAAGFRMLPSVEFAVYFADIKPPFNVGTTPPGDTSTSKEPQGDFFPMPVSLA